ncbi:MAG: FtsB family cell division protein [Bacillota bacterium]
MKMFFPKINKKILIVVSAVLLFIGITFFLFYKFGFLRYYELKTQTSRLKEDIDSVDKQNEALRSEIDSLKTKDAKIERVAREKYNMIRKNEKVFKVVEK